MDNAIFIWIPKTAGTSLWNRLAGAGARKFVTIKPIGKQRPSRGTCTFGHISLAHLLEAGLLSRSYYESSWKFAIVRNPFDRAVSLFEYLMKHGDLPPTTTFPIFCQYIAEGAFEPIGLYNKYRFNQLNPQVAWLVDPSGNHLADFIGRYESIEEDAMTILSKLTGNRVPLKRLNTSKRKPLGAYYSVKEVEIVQTAYKEDFRAFGYAVEPTF